MLTSPVPQLYSGTQEVKVVPSLVGMPIPRPVVMVLDEPDDVEVDDDDEVADNSDEDVMPVITIDDILNSPFIEIAMGEECHDEHDA